MAKKKIVAYSKSKLQKQALEAIRKYRLVFDDEVIAYLPCGKSTYYVHNLHESDDIKSELEKNRIMMKGGLRKKWYESDNTTTQIALYKLIGSEEESDRLNGSRQKLEHTGKDGGPIEIATFEIATRRDVLLLDEDENDAVTIDAQPNTE